MFEDFPKYIAPAEFSSEPYCSCLFDVADGMPKSIALRAWSLEEGHTFLVNEMDFYKEILQAERYAIKTLLHATRGAAGDDAAKTYRWMLTTLYNDQSKVSDRIKKMLQDNLNKARDEDVKTFVDSLGINNGNLPAFYDRFSAH